MKKTIAIIAALFCVLTLFAACGKNETVVVEDDGVTMNPENVRWTTSANFESALGVAGFDFKAPEKLNGNARNAFAVKPGLAVQVGYGKEGGASEILFRKAVATESGDISNDSGKEAGSRTVCGKKASIKAVAGGFSSIIWTADGYDYAIIFETPVNQADLDAVVEKVEAALSGNAGQASSAVAVTDATEAVEATSEDAATEVPEETSEEASSADETATAAVEETTAEETTAAAE